MVSRESKVWLVWNVPKNCPQGAESGDWRIPGLYVLRSLKPVPKFIGGPDQAGVLYIGSTGNLCGRLRLTKERRINHHVFWFTLKPHEVGLELCFPYYPHRDVRLSGLRSVVQKRLGVELRVHRMPFGGVKEVERGLLWLHYEQFGQMPPFDMGGASLKQVLHLKSKEWNEALKKRFALKLLYDSLISIAG
jgi:hypothetical protein